MAAADDGDGRFDDSELDRLVAAMRSPTTASAYYTALFAELVQGAREAGDDDERERYGLQALVVSCALTAARAAEGVRELRAAMWQRADETVADRRAQIDDGLERLVGVMSELVSEYGIGPRQASSIHERMSSIDERFDEIGDTLAELDVRVRSLNATIKAATDDGVQRVLAGSRCGGDT